MTLLPVEPVRVTLDPRKYSWCPSPELTPWCAVPNCSSAFRLQKHHIYRRSAAGRPSDYITIDNLVVPNVCHLCRKHHSMVTGEIGGHKLWIIYDEGWQVYRPTRGLGRIISKDGTAWVRVGPLRSGNHG